LMAFITGFFICCLSNFSFFSFLTLYNKFFWLSYLIFASFKRFTLLSVRVFVYPKPAKTWAMLIVGLRFFLLYVSFGVFNVAFCCLFKATVCGFNLIIAYPLVGLEL
jgi:hypothetical protein